MDGKPRKGIYYGKVVWINPLLEEIRKKECLCLNCKNFKPKWSNNCIVAEKLYKICVENDLALAVSRCPFWQKRV